MKLLKLLLLALATLLFSCIRTEDDTSDPATGFVKLNAPILLEYGATEIFLSDFVFNGAEVDSVLISGKTIALKPDAISFEYTAEADAPRLMLMEIWSGGEAQIVLLKKSNKQPISLTFDPGEKKYELVQTKAEFNGWTESKTPFELIDGIWKADLILSEGRYQYQLVLDGVAGLDPGNEKVVSNNMGGENSLLIVGDPDSEGMPALLTRSAEEKEILFEASNHPKEIIVLWNNTQLPEPLSTEQDRVYSIQIPKEAEAYPRSFIRVYAYNDDGISNDLLIPLDSGSVLLDPEKLSRSDYPASIIYNVFVDRFVNGNADNDKHLPDSIVLPKANYMGGDMQGIEQIINSGYFKSLNVNTLWISPVVKNTDKAYGYWPDPETKFSAYHGYWPTSFTAIDSHFGNPADLKNLVSTAHLSDMNILLDVVANHVHEDHPFYKAHPDKVTQLELPDGSLNLERWDEYRLTTWFDVFLPSLNLEDESVSQMLSDSLLWWAKEYNLDGFRHDAAKHIPLSFWRMLTHKINQEILSKEKRSLYQLGETYGNVELINSYIGKGMLDAQFDFNVYDAAISCFAANQAFSNLSKRLKESLKYYGSHNTMCYITGNQDRARFISYAGGDLLFNEDAKAAGWTREIGVGDTLAYQKLRMLIAFNMTIPGIPVFYYGDEFGMPGGNDPDCRRMMRFGKELNVREKKSLEISQELSRIRKENLALMYGDFLFLKDEGNVLIYARKYFGNSVLIVLNNSPELIDISPEAMDKNLTANGVAHFNNIRKQSGDKVIYSIPAFAFEIITFNE